MINTMVSRPKLFTIGYSPHTIEEFRALLGLHGVTVVGDVRSSPYSSYKPEFNSEQLKLALSEDGIGYVFLGKELGARQDDPTVLTDGVVDYRKVATHPLFQEGLNRLRKGVQEFRIVLMCAEKDPADCHRTVLICRNLKDEMDIQHILANGRLEAHETTEKRLLERYGYSPMGLPGTQERFLDDAYRKQGEKMAYSPE